MKDAVVVDDFLELCRRARVTSLNVGLESGSVRVREEILRRPKYTNEELIAFSGRAREYDVGRSFYVLIGLPGETRDDFAETVRAFRAVRPDNAMLSIFFPSLGTDLYERAKAQGLIPEQGLRTDAERWKATLDLPGFTRRQIQREVNLFWRKAFKGNWSRAKIPSRIKAEALCPHP
jgi:radical SAM superfamily enzyme YgiQ (UPF0313 family)